MIHIDRVPVGRTAEGRNTVRAVELDQRGTPNRIRPRYYRRRVRPLIEKLQTARRAGDGDEMAEICRRARSLAEPQEEFSAITRYLLTKKGIF